MHKTPIMGQFLALGVLLASMEFYLKITPPPSPHLKCHLQLGFENFSPPQSKLEREKNPEIYIKQITVKRKITIDYCKDNTGLTFVVSNTISLLI